MLLSGAVENTFLLLVYVIGLHGVQFENNWMKNFLNLIISKLDKHVVLLLINYIASQSIERKIFEVSQSRKPVGKLELNNFRW